MGIKSHFHVNGFALEIEAWRNSEMTHSYAQFIGGVGGWGKQSVIMSNVKVEN